MPLLSACSCLTKKNNGTVGHRTAEMIPRQPSSALLPSPKRDIKKEGAKSDGLRSFIF